MTILLLLLCRVLHMRHLLVQSNHMRELFEQIPIVRKSLDELSWRNNVISSVVIFGFGFWCFFRESKCITLQNETWHVLFHADIARSVTYVITLLYTILNSRVRWSKFVINILATSIQRVEHIIHTLEKAQMKTQFWFRIVDIISNFLLHYKSRFTGHCIEFSYHIETVPFDTRQSDGCVPHLVGIPMIIWGSCK
jgi:hypothetical protein